VAPVLCRPADTALLGVAVVWLFGCIWSYQEQSAFAASNGFTFPHLLPLVIDGLAVSMAGVSWAASLDARPAIPARLATLIAVGASSGSNGTWAYLRAHHDLTTVGLGIAVPIAANLAFEVLLAELRRQVQRSRGLPAPVAVPYPRLIRLVLAPWQTLRAWRTLVLRITEIEHVVSISQEVQSPPLKARTLDHEGAAPAAPPPNPSPATRATIPVTERSDQKPMARPRPRRSSLPGPLADAQAQDSTGSADSRVVALARHLELMPDQRSITGEVVGELLGSDIAPRTGRRLLREARTLLQQKPERDRAEGSDRATPSELHFAGQRG
jgi:hypothetical protein